MSSIEDQLRALESDDRWFNPGGLTAPEIEALEVEIGLSIPGEVRRSLAVTASSEWAGKRLVQFFESISIRDVNPKLQSDWIPGAFAFASDGGPSWYIVDSEDQLGRGSAAIWELPAGAPFKSEARFVADNLSAFLEWMVEGG